LIEFLVHDIFFQRAMGGWACRTDDQSRRGKGWEEHNINAQGKLGRRGKKTPTNLFLHARFLPEIFFPFRSFQTKIIPGKKQQRKLDRQKFHASKHIGHITLFNQAGNPTSEKILKGNQKNHAQDTAQGQNKHVTAQWGGELRSAGATPSGSSAADDRGGSGGGHWQSGTHTCCRI
jgi:hypothetical protein